MVLSEREKTSIVISHLISLYSDKMEKGNIPPNQSVIDFLIKNIPEQYKKELSMDLIDEVFDFIASRPVELS